MCRFKAYLVTVSPEEVLGADVLVGVLRPLRAGVLVLLVGDVLPVGIPPHLGVDAGNDDAGDSNTVDRVSNCCWETKQLWSFLGSSMLPQLNLVPLQFLIQSNIPCSQKS